MGKIDAAKAAARKHGAGLIAGLMIGTGATAALAPDVPEPPPEVAPIEVGAGVLREPVHVPERLRKLPPLASDQDGDGVPDTQDRCPVDAGRDGGADGCP